MKKKVAFYAIFLEAMEEILNFVFGNCINALHMKRLLHVILLGALVVSTPVAAMAEELFEGPESEVSATTLSIVGRRVRVCGANGETLDVYNLAGVKIASYRIDSADKNIELNLGKGCYLLKVGNLARKFSIR